ncbi:class I SAM-dependent methyltransferase [Clostridium paridis]|uniref:Class I SAM-dependent methyltransferase n=1 Tax=Clostridium paridis TaxID=2803863 RepID=A0A937FHW4_9CLOT|nr:class I SAM-dependent methyltransferase [Clostridium paridis]MBL4931831.1 class I SAM-dependent methyltransferase [Clostridium paridis]
MSRANDRDIVKFQYNSDKNLYARQALHRGFSTNKYGWENWVFDQYMFKPNDKVIEFGCGNGSTWANNSNKIPKDIKVTLTDISEGMLSTAESNLLEIEQIIKYCNMDIQNIKYTNSYFDCAIANHMLYHVQNRDLAISEIARILKEDGTFYVTTNSIYNMKGLKNLVMDFDSRLDYSSFSVASEFGLENGAEQLSKHFESVEKLVYEDSLHITEPKPLVDYVLSLEGHVNIQEIMTESRTKEFYQYLKDIILKDGSIDIPKASGMFIAKKPKKLTE